MKKIVYPSKLKGRSQKFNSLNESISDKMDSYSFDQKQFSHSIDLDQEIDNKQTRLPRLNSRFVSCDNTNIHPANDEQDDLISSIPFNNSRTNLSSNIEDQNKQDNKDYYQQKKKSQHSLLSKSIKSQVLQGLENSIKRQHPKFILNHYLSNEYLQKISQDQSPNRIPFKYLEHIKKLKKKMINTSKDLKNQELENEKLHLTKIKRYDFLPKLQVRMQTPNILKDFDSPDPIKTESSPRNMKNMYKAQFKFKDGRLTLLEKKDYLKQKPLIIDQVEKAKKVLTDYYDSRWQDKLIPSESSFLINEQDYINNYKSRSLEKSQKQPHKKPDQQSLQFTKRTRNIFSIINQVNSSLIKQIKKTKDLINRNNFIKLQKRITKREILMKQDVTNFLLLVHDEDYVKQFRQQF